MQPAHATLTRTVTVADTAAQFGAQFPAAASTPFVLGLAELACHDAVAAELEAHEVTVGLQAIIEHLAPSPVGAVLVVEAHLAERRDRTLTFQVEIFDGGELCAKVRHVRAVVDVARIVARLEARSKHSGLPIDM